MQSTHLIDQNSTTRKHTIGVKVHQYVTILMIRPRVTSSGHLDAVGIKCLHDVGFYQVCQATNCTESHDAVQSILLIITIFCHIIVTPVHQ